MDRKGPSRDVRAAALGDLDLHRTFCRANVDDWTADLRHAGELVHTLASELRHRMRSFGIEDAAVIELLDLERVTEADRRVRALCSDPEAHAARQKIATASPRWRSGYTWACAPGRSVGPLNAAALEALGDFLREMAEQLRAVDNAFAGGLRAAARAGGTGRLPDVGAAGVVACCQTHGIGLRELARDAVAFGVERVHARDGVDPAGLIADRWRKAARKPKRKK
jgi:hypothetical protein